MPAVGLRVAFIAAECEPWAKTGGLADVVDALARALGGDSTDEAIDGPGRCLPAAVSRRAVPFRAVRAGRCGRSRPDPPGTDGCRARSAVVDVAADGYRLRLIDHPAAFDRDGFYGDAAGDYADNAWRFGLFCRAALEALRAEGGAWT